MAEKEARKKEFGETSIEFFRVGFVQRRAYREPATTGGDVSFGAECSCDKFALDSGHTPRLILPGCFLDLHRESNKSKNPNG